MRATRSILVLVFLTLASTLTAAPQSGQERAARELYRIVGGESSAEAGAEAMLQMVHDNPQLAPYADVFRAWFKKVFAEGDLEGEMAAIWMKHFSEAEIRELIAFYQTPLGRKALKAMPEIMKEGAAIGLARANAHQGELEEMLHKAREERAKKEDASQ